MNITEIWSDYQKGRDYLGSVNLYSKAETCHNFINGLQWKGLKYGSERPPQLNILLPMMKASTALVGQNSMSINYTSMNYGKNRQSLLNVCSVLNSNAEKLWERLKMDSMIWKVLEDAYITGDSFLYFYDDASCENGKILCELLDTTNIMLADEQQPDIQKQPYILIVQRKNVNEVKDMARAFGVSEDDIADIVPDSDTETQINGENEVASNSKLTLVAKLWKENGCVQISRSTKSVLVQPQTEITGLSRYPIAQYSWKPRKGLARGDGDVWDKIPNQISINKSLFRLEQAVRSAAYPIKVYRENAVTPNQSAKLNQPGASISLRGNADAPIANVIAYMQPGAISPYAKSYWQDLISLTRDLSGSGDNLENVNPEKASGVAIQSIMDAKTLNVNMQVAAFRQFVEDIAWIWYELLIAYNPEGLMIYNESPDETGKYSYIIPTNILKALDIDIKVDVAPSSNTWAAIRDSQLKEMLEKGLITFEEYVNVLDKNSTMPVEAFRKITESRIEVDNIEM